MTETKYVWISDGGKNMCEECAALDGTEYDSLADVPEKPHPNCNCTVEEISGFVRRRLSPSPWSGKDAPKNIYGNPIYIAPDGTRKVISSPPPFFSKEAVQARQWKQLTEKERKKKDEKLIKEVHQKIKGFEGEKVEHGYACTKGFVTYGPGIMIKNRNDMAKLTLYKQDKKTIATLEEKQRDFDIVDAKKNELGKNGSKDKPYNYKADVYKRKDSLLLLNGDEYTQKYLRENIKTIRERKFKKFDTYPLNAQIVILDMEYNMGPGLHDGTDKNIKRTDKKGYPSFFKAVEKRDWKWAARECTSPEIQKSRNEWRQKLLNGI